MMKGTEYRMGKPKTVTDKPLRVPKANTPLELTAKLAKANTAQAKRVLVAQVMTELFYIWGKTLKPYKSWLTYEENMNEPDWRIV